MIERGLEPLSAAEKSLPEQPVRTGRERIRETVEENIDPLTARLLELSETTKTTWLHCPRCKVNSQVEVPDTLGSVKAIEALLAQGYGRPQPEQQDAGSFVLRRIIVTPQEYVDLEPELLAAGGLAASLDAGGVEAVEPDPSGEADPTRPARRGGRTPRGNASEA